MATLEIRRLDAKLMNICFDGTAGDYADPREPFAGLIQFRPSASDLDPACTTDEVDSRHAVTFDVDRAKTDRDYEAAGRELFGDELYERLLEVSEALVGDATLTIEVDDTLYAEVVRKLKALPLRNSTAVVQGLRPSSTL